MSHDVPAEWDFIEEEGEQNCVIHHGGQILKFTSCLTIKVLMQDLWRIFDLCDDPRPLLAADINEIESLCKKGIKIIRFLVELDAINPVIWLHIFYWHLPFFVRRYGGVWRFTLWGSEAKHAYHRKAFHSAPTRGAQGLAYALDMDNIDWRLREKNLYDKPTPFPLMDRHKPPAKK